MDDKKEDDDEMLLVASGQGNMCAARSLTLRLTPVAYAYAHRQLGSAPDAEDVVQEAMIRLWRIAPNWRLGEARVTTWLYTVVLNLCRDRLRRSGRGVPLETIPEPQDPGRGAAERMEDDDRVRALNSALQQLPERQRRAVELRHLEGLSNPQIAEILGVNVAAVESLTARGKRKLAEILTAHGSALPKQEQKR